MKNRLRTWLLAALLIAVSTGSLLVWSKRQYYTLGPLTESKTLIIRKGSSFGKVVETLHEAGVVRYPVHFKAMALVTEQAKRFKAGEYRFPAGISVQGVIRILAEGRVVVHKLTIPEGLTSQQVARILESKEILEGEIFPQDLQDGSLLPETYHYTYGDTRADLIARMQQAMRKVVHELWQTRQEGLPFTTPKEALTLASIVERETSLDRERQRVAAVYINRLRKNMLLQADPTVLYGIYKETGEMPNVVTYADLKKPSPYNTYLNKGLPPSPIANPGRASIAAVLDPLHTKEIYFVADGKGGHIFAKTFKQHAKNVAAFRKARRKAKQAEK